VTVVVLLSVEGSMYIRPPVPPVIMINCINNVLKEQFKNVEEF
jgi:hypothetical protein